MCGIVGLYRFHSPLHNGDRAWMKHALSKLSPRGPDQQQSLEASNHCILGATRLRITDAHNRNADQPFFDPLTRNILSYNGEIYNHPEVRDKLTRSSFATQSDTETVLAAYAEHGVECCDLFEGMFSFALWNDQEQCLDLCVDPTRQKPLFWLHTEELFAFSSDLETLLCVPDTRVSLDESSLREIIAFRMNIAPNTIWKEINKLPPGHVMRVTPHGERHALQYHFVPLPTPVEREEKLLEVAREETELSCREVITHEHDAFVLLSGGVDSSVVASLLKKGGQSLAAISLGFGEEAYSEFSYSEEMAQLLDLEHIRISFDSESYTNWLTKWIAIAQEPFSSLEAVCLYRIFHELHERGIRVAFSGTGPDEMLDGYRLGHLLHEVPEQSLTEVFFERFSRRGAVDLEQLLGESYHSTRQYVTEKLDTLLAPYDSCGLSVLEQVQILNSHVHLCEYEHRQMDFLSMHYSIEVRNPLCSKRLMHRWFSTPGALRSSPTIEKELWKRVSEKYVPHRIAWRQKRGFPVPNSVKQYSGFQKLMEELMTPESLLVKYKLVNLDYLRTIASRDGEEFRRIFFRLVLLENILQRQLSIVQQSSTQPFSVIPCNG